MKLIRGYGCDDGAGEGCGSATDTKFSLKVSVMGFAVEVYAVTLDDCKSLFKPLIFEAAMSFCCYYSKSILAVLDTN